MQDKPSFCKMREPHVGFPGKIIKMQHNLKNRTGELSFQSGGGRSNEFPYIYLKPGPEANSPNSFITWSGSPSQVREPITPALSESGVFSQSFSF